MRYRTHFRFRPTDEALLGTLLQGTSFDQMVTAGAPALRVGQLIYMLWACQMLRTGMQAQKHAAPPPAARPAPAPKPAAAPPPQTAAPKPAPAPKPAAAPKPAPKPAAAAPASKPTTRQTPKAGGGADEAEFIAELEKYEKKIADQADAFSLLGLPLSAGRKEIRRTWGDLSKRLHPDGLQAKGLNHLRERVNDVFAALSEAQGVLNDRDKRQELREAIERGDSPKDQADAAAQARAAFESELIAKDADKLLKANRFQQAHDKYLAALELNPGEDDLRAAAAWCVYNLSEKTRRDASAVERILAEIVHDNPRIARAHYFRGMVLRDMGAMEAAIISFEEAHTNDSRLIDAERQARALRIAQGRSASREAPKKKGLRDWFKG
jgi:tetratricopeptide (TPR) repeat protein